MKLLQRGAACALAVLCAAALLPGDTAPAPTATAAGALTYTLEAAQTVVTDAELAAGDVTVPVTMYIQNNPGLASVMVTFGTDDPLSITAGDFTNPYCFGTGDPAGAGMNSGFNVSAAKLLWNSGQNGGLVNETARGDDVPFMTFDVLVPKNTPAGVYSISFVNERIPVVTDADGNVIYTPTCSTVRVEDEINLVTMDVVYQGTSIQVGTSTLRGDADLSFKVDLTDVGLVLRAYSVSLLGASSPLTAQQQINADVDRSGVVNAADATFILRYLAQEMLGTTPDWNKIVAGK